MVYLRIILDVPESCKTKKFLYSLHPDCLLVNITIPLLFTHSLLLFLFPSFHIFLRLLRISCRHDSCLLWNACVYLLPHEAMITFRKWSLILHYCLVDALYPSLTKGFTDVSYVPRHKGDTLYLVVKFL